MPDIRRVAREPLVDSEAVPFERTGRVRARARCAKHVTFPGTAAAPRRRPSVCLPHPESAVSLLRLSVLLCAVLLPPCLPARASEDVSELSYDARLTGYEYEFGVKFFPFASQGQSLEMAYIFLPGEAGKPVVTLLHGKNFNADYWASTARHLQKQGYGVLMPDQIGFGKSSKPVHYQYSFPALASNTRALMKSLGIERSVVIGHSMGGMLASRFALMFPQTVQQLVLVNPIGLENYLKYAEYKDTDFFYKAEQAQTAAQGNRGQTPIIPEGISSGAITQFAPIRWATPNRSASMSSRLSSVHNLAPCVIRVEASRCISTMPQPRPNRCSRSMKASTSPAPA
jgi:pimeloyl-ACP methyl ester carboxylesterase